MILEILWCLIFTPLIIPLGWVKWDVSHFYPRCVSFLPQIMGLKWDIFQSNFLKIALLFLPQITITLLKIDTLTTESVVRKKYVTISVHILSLHFLGTIRKRKNSYSVILVIQLSLFASQFLYSSSSLL